MPFDGSGNYVAAAAPNFPAVGGTTIASAYYNATINDIVTALNNVLTRDGQGKPSANIDWNAKKITNLAVGSANGDAVAFQQLAAYAILAGNNAFIGTLSATGLITGSAGFSGTTLALTGAASAASFLAQGTISSYNIGFSSSRAGSVGYHLYNNGTVTEWVIYQPAHATDDSFHIATGVGGVVTDRLVIDPSGAVTLSGNLVVTAGNLTVTTQAVGDSSTKAATTAFVDRLRDVPVNIYTANHNVDASHRGGGADFNGANLTATIVAGLSDGYTALITNLNATNLTITSASDVLTLAGTTTTGNRTLGQNGMATVRRVNGILLIGGNGLS